MKKALFAWALLAVVGCATSPDPDEVWDASRKEVVEGFDVRNGAFSRGVSGAYGIWIGRGPRILASDGTMLTNARVVFGNDPMAEGLPIDETGCVIVNRYVSGGYSRGCRRHHDVSGSLTVSCPGYHSAIGASLLDGQGVVKEIRLKPVLAQPPCRTFSSEAMVVCDNGNGCCGFDLLEGDWLPPYGWGKVEDLRVTVSTNLSSATTSYTISHSGVKRVVLQDNRQVVRLEFVRDGDGFGKDGENFSDCTNRVVFGRQFERDVRGVFKVRGHYGSIDSTEFRKDRSYYYAEEVVDGRRRDVRRDGPETYWLKFGGRVNTVAGLKGLETATASVSPRPPTPHPVPKDVNRMAFGVSEDGRSAVCFGWTKDGAAVPEIFRKGVYTADPARDLPGLETLYLNLSAHSSEQSPVVCGLKNLRTVVWCDGFYARSIGVRAFADNPKLDAVIFDGSCHELTVAADSFSGSATNLTAVYTENSYNCNRPWDAVAVSNVFSRMAKVFTVSRSNDSTIASPEADLARGEVELPVMTLEDGHLDKEYSDGRIIRYRKDGFSERLFK